MSIRKLPWKKLLKWFWLLRAVFFTTGKPEGKSFVIVLTEKDIEKLLGKIYFTHDWEFSYNYRGEDINMRRCFYKHDRYNWYQFHIRGWILPNGDMELKAHTELEPSEYPRLHLKGVNLDEEEGMEMLKKILEEHNISYKIKGK